MRILFFSDIRQGNATTATLMTVGRTGFVILYAGPRTDIVQDENLIKRRRVTRPVKSSEGSLVNGTVVVVRRQFNRSA
jgi:hypothetical protein